MFWVSCSEQSLKAGEGVLYFRVVFFSCGLLLKNCHPSLSHWPKAAARDFPTGTSLSLSERGGGVSAVLSLGVQQIMSFLVRSHSPFIVCTSRGCEDGQPRGTKGLEQMTW